MAVERSRRRTAVLFWGRVVAGSLLTAVLYYGTVVVTSLIGCGVSGCRGGGFGPAYNPWAAQIGLLVAGVMLLPGALWLFRNRGRRARALAGVGAVVLGATVAMLVVGLGPDGCPRGESRATTGPQGFHPGSSTCSGDPDAVPR